MTDKTAAEMLAEIRAATGMSYDDLAPNLAVRSRTLYRWANGAEPQGEARTGLEALWRKVAGV